MNDPDLAHLLAQTADLMEIAGDNPFRVYQYRAAALLLITHPERIRGPALAQVLEQLRARGSCDRRDEILATHPLALLDLLDIDHVGPRTVAKVWDRHRVSTVEGIARLCRAQQLRLLPRLGPKIEAKILRAADSAQARADAGPAPPRGEAA